MNILLVTTDQQRADSIGAYGNEICQTPNLDSLAARGTKYTACRCQNPYCQPSRATILTGTHPSTHGVISVGIDFPLDLADRTLPALLGKAGFKTALFGKAHLASAFPTYPTGRVESVEGSAAVDPEWHGPYFGFDHAEMVLFGHNVRVAPAMGSWNWAFGPPPFGLHYARWLARGGRARGRERLRLMQPEAAKQGLPSIQTWKSALPEEDHSTTWIGDRATQWLEKVEGPFFGWVSFCDPHHPLDPPAPWSEMYSPADLVHSVPKPAKGELQGKPRVHQAWAAGFRGTPFEWANPGGGNLKRGELAAMTAGYYALVSQVDAQVGRLLEVLERRRLARDTLVVFTSDHGDLLGDHLQLFKGPVHYEGLLRVPLIIRGPGFKARRVVSDPVGLVDLAPTLLQAAGLQPPDWMEGRPLDAKHEQVLTENEHRTGFQLSLRTLTTDRYKLTRYVGRDGVGELYDLKEDPGEMRNLWDDGGRWSVRSDLLALLEDSTSRQVRNEARVSLIG